MKADRVRFFAVLVVLSAALSGTPGSAVELPGLSGLEVPGGRVVVDAESVSYDDKAHLITARGAVKVTYGSLVLTADRVTIQRDTAIAEANGNVELASPGSQLLADFAHIDLGSETGWVEEGEFTFGPKNLRIVGRRIEKLEGQNYSVQAGELTTCLCGAGKPSWNLRSERVVVDLYGHGSFRAGRFEILGRPILYVPAGFFPVRRERQSGLLRPRFGLSSFRGVQLEQPIYWAINKSMDATVGIDVESGSRVGLASEYRYMLSTRSRGEIGASYFNERMRGLPSADVVNRQIADPSIPENRWSVKAWHDQNLPADSRAYLDLVRVGDDLMLREVNAFSFDPAVDVAMRTKRFERSRVGVVKRLDRGLVHLNARFYQDFINPDGLTLDSAPELEAYGEQGFLDGRVVGRVTAFGTNFERGSDYQGRRMFLQPSMELPWHWRDIAHGFVEGGVRTGFYDLDDTELPAGLAQQGLGPLDARASRQLFFAAAEMGTQLSRVYPWGKGSGMRLKHTIEPTLRYFYVPEEGQGDIPLFDEFDRMRSRNVFTYGIVSRVLRKRAPGGENAPAERIREMARLAVGQSYDVANEDMDGEHASDLSVGLSLSPSDYLTLFGRSDLSIGQWEPRGTSVGFSVADPRPLPGGPALSALEGRTRLEATYRFVADRRGGSPLAASPEAEPDNTRIEEANARFVLRTTGRLFVAAEARYDAVSKRFLENRYGIRLISKCDCWVVDLGVADRVNPDEVVVQATVTLVGLGSLGKGSASDWQQSSYLGGGPSLF